MKKMYVLVLSLAVLLVAAAVGYAHGPGNYAANSAEATIGMSAMAGMQDMHKAAGMDGMHKGMGMGNMDINTMLEHHNQMHGTSITLEEMQTHHNSMHGSGMTGKMGCGN